MGNNGSYEQRLASAKRHVEEENPIEVKFPGFRDNEEAFLRHKQDTAKVLENIPTLINKLVTFVGGPEGGGNVVRALMSLIHESADSIEKALVMLKVDKKIVQNAHSFVKAEMLSIERQLKLSLAGEQRKTHLAIADDSCYKLLVKFADTDFYLHQNPLAFAPFLASFVAIYIPVTRANYHLARTTERREDLIRNLEALHRIIEDFRDETDQHRVNCIHFGPVFGTEGDTCLSDSLINKDIYYQTNSLITEPLISEIKEWYRAEVRRKYKEYFTPSLEIVEQTLNEIRE